MSLDNFKRKVREYFSILSVTPEISDNEWLNFAKKLESEKPLNRAQANIKACKPKKSGVYNVAISSSVLRRIFPLKTSSFTISCIFVISATVGL